MRPSPIRPRSRWLSVFTGLALCVALNAPAGCKKSEEAPAPAVPVAFHVTRVELGNAIGTDKRVIAPAVTFKPGDTIYASISSEGAAASAVLGARWTFEDGQLVNETTQNIAPSGPAVTEFHIAKPDGWPVGKYALAVTVDGKPAGAAQFTVSE